MFLRMGCLRLSMPVRRGKPLRHAARKDSNHGEIESGLERLGFLIIDSSKLGSFVDLVIKHPSKDHIGVRLIEIKTAKGKMSEEQRKLKTLWEDSIIEAHTLEDVLKVYEFI